MTSAERAAVAPHTNLVDVFQGLKVIWPFFHTSTEVEAAVAVKKKIPRLQYETPLGKLNKYLAVFNKGEVAA